MTVLLPLAALILAGYPLAARLRLPWDARLLTATAVGLVGGAALAWLTGVLAPALRPDAPVWALSLVGMVLLLRDLWRCQARHWHVERGWALVLVSVLAVAALQYSFTVTSGWRDGSLVLVGHHSHDGAWHLAIAAMLRPGEAFATPWPPPNPVWADQPLVNYHPLSDVLVALLAPHEAQVTAYFQVLPAVYSLLVLSAAAWVAREWGASYRTTALTVVLTGLTGSLGHLVALLGEPPSWESAFWMSQLISMLVNPPWALSFGALLVGLALFSRHSAPPVTTACVLGILWGVSFGVKAYLPVLVVPALAFASLRAPAAERRRPLLALGAVLLGAAAMLLLTTRAAAGVLYFEPRWLLWTLLVAPDRLGLPLQVVKTWPLPLQLPAMAGLALLALPLYVAGNLGIRLLGLPRAWHAVRNPPGSTTATAQCAAAAIAGLGLLLPLLLGQRGVIWNTIQFGYYALGLLVLWTAPEIARRLAAASPTRRAGLALLLAALALPTTAHSLLTHPGGTVIPAAEVAKLRQLRETLPVGSRILIAPDAPPVRAASLPPGFQPAAPAETAYVAAIMGRPTYCADPLTLRVLNLPGEQRRAEFTHVLRLPPPARQAWLAARRIAAIYPGVPE